MLNIIVAVSENNVIGNNGGIPWRIPGELAYFKKITMGHPVVMGRKTYDSIGKALPERDNYVYSRQKLKLKNAILTHDTARVIKMSEDGDEIFIIGGATIYDMFMPHADRIYLTRVHMDFKGDVFFKMDNSWQLVSSKEGLPDVIPHTFEIYERDKRGTEEYPKELILRHTEISTEPGLVLNISEPRVDLLVYRVDDNKEIRAIVKQSWDSEYKPGDHVVVYHTEAHLFEKDYEDFKSRAYNIEKRPIDPIYAVHTILQMLLDKNVITERDMEIMEEVYKRDPRITPDGCLFGFH